MLDHAGQSEFASLAGAPGTCETSGLAVSGGYALPLDPGLASRNRVASVDPIAVDTESDLRQIHQFSLAVSARQYGFDLGGQPTRSTADHGIWLGQLAGLEHL